MEKTMPPQAFAERLLVRCVKALPGAEKTIITNAWCYHFRLIDKYFFTFELQASPGGASAFYGNDALGFPALTETFIEKAAKAVLMDIDYFYVKNGVRAVKKGEKLDAAALGLCISKNA